MRRIVLVVRILGAEIVRRFRRELALRHWQREHRRYRRSLRRSVVRLAREERDGR